MITQVLLIVSTLFSAGINAKIFDLELKTCDKSGSGSNAYVDVRLTGTLADCERKKINQLSLYRNKKSSYAISCADDVGFVTALQLRIDRSDQPCFVRVRLLDPVDKDVCFFSTTFEKDFWIKQKNKWTEKISQSWEDSEESVKFGGPVGHFSTTHDFRRCKIQCASTAPSKGWRWNRMNGKCECLNRIETRFYESVDNFISGAIDRCADATFPRFLNSLSPVCDAMKSAERTYENGTTCRIKCVRFEENDPEGVVVCRSTAVWRSEPNWDVLAPPNCGLPVSWIAGLTVGSAVGVGLVCFVVYLTWKRYEFKKQQPPHTKGGGGDAGGKKKILKHRTSYVLALKDKRDDYVDFGVVPKVSFSRAIYEASNSDSDSIESGLQFRLQQQQPGPSRKISFGRPRGDLRRGGDGGEDAERFLPPLGNDGESVGSKRRKLSTIFISPHAFQQTQPKDLLRRLSRELPSTLVFTDDGAVARSPPQRTPRERRLTPAQGSLVDSTDIFEANQRTFAAKPAAFIKSEQTFERGQNAFKKGPSTFERGQNAFKVGPDTFEQNQKTFLDGQNMFQEGREVFKTSNDAFQAGQRRFDRGKEAFEQGQTRFQRTRGSTDALGDSDIGLNVGGTAKAKKKISDASFASVKTVA